MPLMNSPAVSIGRLRGVTGEQAVNNDAERGHEGDPQDHAQWGDPPLAAWPRHRRAGRLGRIRVTRVPGVREACLGVARVRIAPVGVVVDDVAPVVGVGQGQTCRVVTV